MRADVQMNAEEHTTRSPSGAVQVEADDTQLIVKAKVTAKPFLVSLVVLSLAGIAVYLPLHSKESLSSFWVISCGLLGFAACILNSSRCKTTLRFAAGYAELTEVRLFTTSRKRVVLNRNAEPGVESREDGYEGFINFLRLKVAGESHLDVLRGHTAEDVVWVWAAIQHWREGGPHNMALHLTALARRR
jgi:hypothetical protein